MKATHVMSSPAIVLFPDMTIKEAGRILAGHRIGGAPVVDRTTSRLIGIISQGDLLNADRIPITRPLQVSEVMTPDVVCVDHFTDIKEVATRLLDADLHRVPVLHDDEVVGVVSRHDLLKQMCRTDASITVEVANLLKEEGTSLSRLEVDVKEGIAYIHGDAGPLTKALALDLARSLPGVLGAQLRVEAPVARRWAQVPA
jgi:predicted transcriptional regulator